MTDKEIIRAMLNRAGLEYDEGTRTYPHMTGTQYDIITVEDQGYSGFVCEFWFDPSSGALKHMAGWE